MITWSFGLESERETRLSEVVAIGDDFVIYLTDLRLNSKSAASYVAEFSGIHVTSCVEDMPNETERSLLANAWPLKSGDLLEIGEEISATYTIGKLTSHTLNTLEGPTQARLIKAVFGNVENDITLSLDWNTAVAVSWADGSGDKALEVVPPSVEAKVRRDIADDIGKCAALLEN